MLLVEDAFIATRETSQNNGGDSTRDCPPLVASRDRQVMVLCGRAGLSGFRIMDNRTSYTCSNDNREIVCRGTIDSRVEVATCSQPSIPSCAKYHLYHDYKNTSTNGPCWWDDVSNLREAAYCNHDEGTFACFDEKLGEWCEGSVEGTPPPTPDPTLPTNLEYTCPPETVYSFSEASYYCLAQSNLYVYQVLENYYCNWNGILVCQGQVSKPRFRPADCSATIASCDTQEMQFAVCDDLSTIPLQKECDDRKSMTFECFDRTMNQYCVGRVDNSSISTTTAIRMRDGDNPGYNGEEDDQPLSLCHGAGHNNATIRKTGDMRNALPVAVMLVLFFQIIVGLIVVWRRGKQFKHYQQSYEPVATVPNIDKNDVELSNYYL
uniref:Uncharacterized protein n=1 Tax=Amphora coffeiformis TaxID=265554 RepID=A0A7S3KYZ8_9STRA